MSEILHKNRPGTTGYRDGCRCDGCRAAQRAAQARRRARKAAEAEGGPVLRPVPGPSAGRVAPPPDVERRAGIMETRVIAEIESLWNAALWDAECETWEAQALDAARRLDDGAATTHVAPLTRLKNEAMRELRLALKRAVVPPGDEGEGIDDFLVEIHSASIVCQTEYPRVVPGACKLCDAKAGR